VVYGDGWSFSSEDGPPSSCPRTGVQVVAVADERCGRTLWHGGNVEHRADYFVWRDETWVQCDLAGLHDYLFVVAPEHPVALMTRSIRRERFLDIYAEALADPRLPAKAATRPDEPGAP
jgi:hypothetical protein